MSMSRSLDGAAWEQRPTSATPKPGGRDLTLYNDARVVSDCLNAWALSRSHRMMSFASPYIYVSSSVPPFHQAVSS